jgi:WD40 repeat protein/serine/threonine protein kinase
MAHLPANGSPGLPDDEPARHASPETVDVPTPTIPPAEGQEDSPRDQLTTTYVEKPGSSAALLPLESGMEPGGGRQPVSAAGRSFGDYELLKKIAHGGMGVVYKAVQKKLHRTVALKMIRAGDLASPEELARFYSEAEAAAQLDHPGIVPVYEVGSHEGQHFFSMGFVEGGSLAARIRERPLRPREAATLMRQVAEAVAYAHQCGIIHRDLKPSNVLLGVDGRPKVTDFGIARNTKLDSHLTLSGQVMGTPSYMSPEQATGKTELIGPAADIYSLGATLYCLVTGRPPFQAASAVETLRQVVQYEPVPPRQLNAAMDHDLETICLKCLQKEPPKRYHSAKALADDLGHWLRGEPIDARPVGRGEKIWRWCRRNPLDAALTATAAGLLIVGTIVSLYFAIQAYRGEQKALANAKLADANAAEARLSAQRERDAKALSDRRRYVAEINMAYQLWKDGKIALLQQRLKELGPQRPGDPDLRGFEWHYLRRLCHLELTTLTGHTEEIRSVAFSADGRWLATAGDDSTVKVWDVPTNQERHTLRGHTARVRSVAFSPDGRRLASAGDDKTIHIWDMATGGTLQTLSGHTRSVVSVAFSSDGRLASGSSDQTIKYWDITTGRLIRSWSTQDAGVRCVAFSTDGRHLVSAGVDGTIKIWEVASGRHLRTAAGHRGTVYGIAFSPDGRLFASASQDTTLKLWRFPSGSEVRTLPGQSSYVYGVAFSGDGRHLASAGADGLVKVWDTATGEEKLTLRGHAGPVNSVAFHPDARRLASGSLDHTIKIWDATADQTPMAIHGYSSPIDSVVFSSDGKRLATACADKAVKILDAATGMETIALHANTSSVNSMTFSPCGRWLACAVEGEVRICSPATGELLRSLPGHVGKVLKVAFSSDGQYLASAGDDQTVRIWDTARWQLLQVLRGHTGAIQSVAFNLEGQQVATATAGGSVGIWDVVTGQQLRTLSLHGIKEGTVTFSRDARQLAAATTDGSIRLWDLASGDVVFTLSGHTSPPETITYSPDGRRLASASFDHSVKVWDVATGQETLAFLRQPANFYAVAFSPDSRRLAASDSNDNAVLIWDASPVSPEVLVQRQANSLVRFLFAKPLSRREVLARIQADRTISEPVRQQALALAREFGPARQPHP